MEKMNRGIVRDALAQFLQDVNEGSLKTQYREGVSPYRAGAMDFAAKMQELFGDEKNIHLGKNGQVQQRYRFHYKVGVLPTSIEKWMSREEAESFAAKKGYRLELIRTTHKAGK